MKNRKAWGLVGIVVVLLLGSGVLFVIYQSRLPPGQRVVEILGPDDRDFGQDIVHYMPISSSTAPSITEKWLKLGLFRVRLERHIDLRKVTAPPSPHPGPSHDEWTAEDERGTSRNERG
jgi:hypothetical protein